MFRILRRYISGTIPFQQVHQRITWKHIGILKMYKIRLQKNITILFIFIVMLSFSYWLANSFGMKWGVLAIIGFFLGFTLSFSRFGIVAGWRDMLTMSNSYYVRIHLITIALEVVLFTLCLSFSHAFFGGKMVGNITAISIPFLVGAFVFGIGMQIAGACASGTLYCCGEGRPAFWFVLCCYGIGTLIGNHYKPVLKPIFPGEIITTKDITGGLWSGMLLSLVFILILYLVFSYVEKKRTGKISKIITSGGSFWKDNRFTVLSGGLIIAVLNSLVLAMHGSAWTITGAIYDTSLHTASFLGVLSDNSVITKPLFQNPMVGMFVGGLLGAAMATVLTGKRIKEPLTRGSIMAGITGGLLMGTGGAYASCNLGGFFDGTASGSLHGWLWMFMALAGSVIGINLRRFFICSRC